MATRAKKKEKTFKHLLGQWPDFKMIFHRNVPLIPFIKIAKFCSAEQNGRQS